MCSHVHPILSQSAFRRFQTATLVVFVSRSHCGFRYPEMLKRCLVVRAPWIFDLAWSLVKHFFDEGPEGADKTNEHT